MIFCCFFNSFISLNVLSLISLENFDSSSNSQADTIIVGPQHFQEMALRNQVKWQEDWLKTQLTSTQLDKYHRFMRQTELPRSEAIPKFIKQKNIIISLNLKRMI